MTPGAGEASVGCRVDYDQARGDRHETCKIDAILVITVPFWDVWMKRTARDNGHRRI